MFDRHLLGDVTIAILLAVPTAALSRPQTAVPQHPNGATQIEQQAAQVDQSTTERRFTIESEG